MTSPAMLLAGNATAATAFVALALAAAPTLAAGENIALHRPYTWNRPPDYPLTTDPDDARQLTDGLRAKTTPLWRDTAAVGWGPAASKFVSLTIDLGTVQQIEEVSWSTAAGRADVHLPRKLLLYLSDDGKVWMFAGDMVERDANRIPEPTAYVLHSFRIVSPGAHGRFVRIVVDYKNFLFCDEIEVLTPEKGAPRTASSAALLTGDPERHAWRTARDDGYVKEVASRIPESTTGETLKQELAALTQDLTRNPPTPKKGARAVLPLDDRQRRLFALGGRALAARKAPALYAWRGASRYDPLGPLQAGEPGRGDVVLSLRAMTGERRADAVNLVNATGQRQHIHLDVRGLPTAAHPALLAAAFVDTVAGDVAAALLELAPEGGGWTFDLDAGMTGQIWLLVRPDAAAKPGLYGGGKLAIAGQGVRFDVPVRLRISRLSAARPRLHLGGWDYIDTATAYDVGATNRTALVEFLRAHGVDSTWAHRSILPDPADFADRTQPRSRNKFAEFDAWIARWPDARARFVFLAGGDDFQGARRGSPEFAARVGDWMSKLAAYVATKASPGAVLGILPVDEPATAEQSARVHDWATAIRSAAPRPLVFEDPVFARPSTAGAALEVCDILSPSWTQYLKLPPEERVALEPRADRELWFYDTKGPVRALDPVAYHRLASWVAFRAGARGIGFWSFADAGGGSSWNEYEATRGGGFAPEFLAPDGVTLSKHMMGIEEGPEDHERLSMLAQVVARMGAEASPALTRARTFLAEASPRVLARLDRSPDDEILWSVGKDRTLVDAVADEALDLLEALQ